MWQTTTVRIRGRPRKPLANRSKKKKHACRKAGDDPLDNRNTCEYTCTALALTLKPDDNSVSDAGRQL